MAAGIQFRSKLGFVDWEKTLPRLKWGYDGVNFLYEVEVEVVAMASPPRLN